MDDGQICECGFSRAKLSVLLLGNCTLHLDRQPGRFPLGIAVFEPLPTAGGPIACFRLRRSRRYGSRGTGRVDYAVPRQLGKPPFERAEGNIERARHMAEGELVLRPHVEHSHEAIALPRDQILP